MKNIGKKVIWFSLGIILSFNGCSNSNFSQENVSDSSMNIIMSYSKKSLPDGYVWNFGTGRSYSSALEDASQSLSFEQATEVETKVIISNKERIISDQYGNKYYTSPTKIMETKGKNKYRLENSCELHKLLNTSDGVLIIRICKNLNFFESKIEDSRKNSVFATTKKVHTMSSMNLYFHLNEIKGLYTKDDIYTIKTFLKEIVYLNEEELWWNFPSNNEKDIENFVLTSYKTWLNSFPLESHHRLNNRVYYPYQWQKNPDTFEREPSELWRINGNKVTFSLAKKLTIPQKYGYVQPDDFFKNLVRVK